MSSLRGGRPWLPFVMGLLLLLFPQLSRSALVDEDGFSIESLAIPAGREDAILALFAPYRLGDELSGDFRWTALSIGKEGFTATVSSRTSTSSELRLEWSARAHASRIHTDERATPEFTEWPEAAREATEGLRAAVARNLDERAWDALLIKTLSHDARREPPPMPGARFPMVASALALLLCGLGMLASRTDGIRSRIIRLTLVAAGIAIGMAPPFVHAHLTRSVDGRSATRSATPQDLDAIERFFVAGMLAAAMAVLGVLLIRGVATLWRAHRTKRTTSLAGSPTLDFILVGAWSLLVRLGLTATNLLTDGGSGWGRLLEYRRGFGGVAVLVDFVLPDRPIFDSIAVPKIVAALAPPLLVLIARELGWGRLAGLLAGLALASLPIHAAVYSSDFEVGAVLSLQLLGLWLLLRGARRTEPLTASGGLLVLAYAVWGRPEALAVGLPMLVALLPLRSRLLSPALLGACAWCAGSFFVRLQSLESFGADHPLLLKLLGAFTAFTEVVSSAIVVPWWLWLTLPVGLLCLRSLPGRSVAFLAALALQGFAPLTAVGLMSGDELEFVRYATGLLPVVALLVGLGWAGVGSFAAERLSHRSTHLSPRIPIAAMAGLAMMSTPLLSHEYLSRIYGPTREYQAFLDALRRTPGQCTIVVPDDDGIASLGMGTLEIFARYERIASEVHAAGLSHVKPSNVVATTRFLEEGASSECVLHFRGVACFDGARLDPVTSCRDLAARYDLELLESFPMEYFSHRLVARPHRLEPPHYFAHLSLDLFRVIAKHEDGEANDPRLTLIPSLLDAAE